MTDVGERIDTDAVRLPAGQLPVDARLAVAVDAEYNGCDALVQVGCRVLAVVEVEFRVTVHVDETRCDPFAVGDDGFGGRYTRGCGIADKCDPAVADSDIRSNRFAAATVEDQSARDQQRNFSRRLRRLRAGREHGGAS